MIALLRQVADPGTGEGARWAQMRMHRIRTDILTQFGASSKLNAEWDFVVMLRTEGRKATSEFLIDERRRPRQALDSRSGCTAGGVLNHGPPRHPCRARSPHLAGLPRLERVAAGAGCCARRRSLWRRTAARQLDADFHGQRGPLLGSVLPAVPARRRIRQAHGRQRLGVGRRKIHDGKPGRAPRDARGRARGRVGHLWWRQSVRRLLCACPHGPSAVPVGGYSPPPDAGRHHTWHLNLHHVGFAGHALDPKCNPDAVFRHYALCRARPWHHRVVHHAWPRPVVAETARGRGPPLGRGLWHGRVGRRRCRGGRRDGARAGHHGARVRSGRDPSRAPQRLRSVHCHSRIAARRGGPGQSDDVAFCSASAGLLIPGRTNAGVARRFPP